MFKEGVKIFCKINGVNIPLVSTGTSPFIGAGQFGIDAFEWRRRFLNNPNAILEILEASYANGSRGIEVIPSGRILEAAQIMIDMHNDYVITGSTYPGTNPKIDSLIDVGAKMIFVHGMISDERGIELLEIIEEISAAGIIPGIATHKPVSTIRYCIENSLNVQAFLIPFNATGFLMENKEELEKIVDNTQNVYFIGMKTLAAGKISPNKAFEYISKHNICAVTIGMVNKKEAEQSTAISLEFLNNNYIYQQK
ncbi:MAG: hypothetical protein ACFE9Z_02410 [Promethearchaeota archaeon]